MEETDIDGPIGKRQVVGVARGPDCAFRVTLRHLKRKQINIQTEEVRFGSMVDGA